MEKYIRNGCFPNIFSIIEKIKKNLIKIILSVYNKNETDIIYTTQFQHV